MSRVSQRSVPARRNLGPLLVGIGTLGVPIAQWIVFWLVARFHGPASAGSFALLLAVSTPIFTLTNFGLRSNFITLQRRFGFRTYLIIRIYGSVLGLVTVIAFGLVVGIDNWLVFAVVLQKVADAFLDILFAWFQRHRQLIAFGLAMSINGLTTIVCATILAFSGGPIALIVAGSACGSVFALVVALGTMARTASQSFRRLTTRVSLVNAFEILRTSWPIAVGQLLAVLVVNMPIWAVGLASTPTQFGRFAAVAYLLTVGSLAGTALNSVFIGEYQAQVGAGKRNPMIRRATRGSLTITGVGLLAVIALVLVGGSLFQVVYGSQFDFTRAELLIIGLAAALNPGTQLMNAALLALNLYNKQMFIVAWAVAAVVGAAAIGIAIGLSGVILGCVSALAGSVVKYVLSSVALKTTLAVSIGRNLP